MILKLKDYATLSNFVSARFRSIRSKWPEKNKSLHVAFILKHIKKIIYHKQKLQIIE